MVIGAILGPGRLFRRRDRLDHRPAPSTLWMSFRAVSSRHTHGPGLGTPRQGDPRHRGWWIGPLLRVLRSDVLIVTRRDYVAARVLLGFTLGRPWFRGGDYPQPCRCLITGDEPRDGDAVVVEAILSFVGLGVKRNQIAPGARGSRNARQYVYQSPGNLLFPDPGDLPHRARVQHDRRRICGELAVRLRKADN